MRRVVLVVALALVALSEQDAPSSTDTRRDAALHSKPTPWFKGLFDLAASVTNSTTSSTSASSSSAKIKHHHHNHHNHHDRHHHHRNHHDHREKPEDAKMRRHNTGIVAGWIQTRAGRAKTIGTLTLNDLAGRIVGRGGWFCWLMLVERTYAPARMHTQPPTHPHTHVTLSSVQLKLELVDNSAHARVRVPPPPLP